MAKPVSLTSAALTVATPTPAAATAPRAAPTAPAAPKIKVTKVPLQVHLPPEDAKAIRRAAVESELSISDYILTCFHAYHKT